jgi:hypothetical protein
MFRAVGLQVGPRVVLLAVAGALVLPNLGVPSLWDIDEGNNSEAAREMLESGNWVVPTFNFALRVDKPALLYWLQMSAYGWLGVGELAARLPSALAALVTVWLTYELVQQLDTLGNTPNPAIVNAVIDWFADKFLERTEIKKNKVEAEAKAEVKAGGSIFGFGLKLLASVKSVISGSVESRDVVRNHVAQYGDTLIGKFNILLGEASAAFRAAGRTHELLIVVDNLDRLDADPGRRLFITNGELLQRVQAHMVYTVPIAAALAPDRLSSVFRLFTLPTINPAIPAARQALIDLVARRIDIDLLFNPTSLVADLVVASGGSLRDLIRLIDYAQQEAKVTNGRLFDRHSVEFAINQLREDYKKSLFPAGTYFPVLARIQQTGGDSLAELAGDDEQGINNARRFFRELLNNGTVLEYNGGVSHYAVHPVVQQIEAFKNALQEIQKSKPPGRAAKKAATKPAKATGTTKRRRAKGR